MKGSSPDPSTTSAGGLTNTNTPIAGDGTQLQAGAQPFRPPPPFSLTAESAAPPHRYEPPSFGAVKQRPVGGTSPSLHTYSPGVPSYGSGSKAGRPLLNNSMSHMGTPNSVPPVQGKFKTEMCRNWELMGQCTYRGCTYAHGPDDLRQAPMTYDVYGRSIPNPAAGQQGRYPNQQAPMYQGGEIHSNQGSTHTTPVGGTRQSSLSRSAPQPISASAPTVASEQIIDMILVEVRHERDDLLQQVNASKQLEADLRREQRRRQAVVRTQRALEGVLQMLKQEINERTRLLNEVLRAKGDYDFEAVLDDVMDSEEEAREEHHRGLDSDDDQDDYHHRQNTTEYQDVHHSDPYASQHNSTHNASAPSKAPASNVWGNTGMGTVTSSSTLVDFDLQALDDLIEGGSSASGSSTSPRGRGSHRGQQGRGTSRGGAPGSKTSSGQAKPSAWGEPRGGRGGSGRGGSGRGAAAPKRR